MGHFDRGTAQCADEMKTIISAIPTSTDVVWLATLIAADQFDYWYDPCGKSGHDLNDRLTDVSKAAVRRIHALRFGEP